MFIIYTIDNEFFPIYFWNAVYPDYSPDAFESVFGDSLIYVAM
jgi:hypothetical protein